MQLIIIRISRCLLIGIIWAALLMPVIFRKGGALKYAVTVSLTALICYIFSFVAGNYASLINRMTLASLVALVISWITSMAVFDKESKIKSKVIAFSCLISGISYLIVSLFIPEIAFL